MTREQGCGDVGWGLGRALPQKLRLLTPGGGGDSTSCQPVLNAEGRSSRDKWEQDKVRTCVGFGFLVTQIFISQSSLSCKGPAAHLEGHRKS